MLFLLRKYLRGLLGSHYPYLLHELQVPGFQCHSDAVAVDLRVVWVGPHLDCGELPLQNSEGCGQGVLLTAEEDFLEEKFATASI